MFPQSELDNISNSPMTNIIFNGEFLLGNSAKGITLSYFFDLVIIQLGIVVSYAIWHKTQPGGMFAISLAGYIFQVSKVGVGLNAIYVINFHSFWAFTQECECNETMHQPLLRDIVPAQRYSRVPVVIRSRPHVCVQAGALSTFYSLDVAEIGYLVNSFVSRYISPLFNFNINHMFTVA